jgi:Domain of unknown function (DUF4384)
LGDAANYAAPVRTMPDMPHPENSSAETQGAAGPLNTKSDVNAATIVTVDAVPTSRPSTPQPAKIPPVALGGAAASPGPAQGAPANAGVDDLASSVTIQQKPRTPAPVITPQKSRLKPLVFVGAGVLLLVLGIVAVGGFFAVNWWKGRSESSTGATTGNGKTTTKGTSDSTQPATSEFGRYWLEVLPNAAVTEPMRVAGAVPLASGQAFKFHFELGENGYLYIIGPGERNQPTAFLTAKPAAISGLDNNEISKGSDFSFPSGLEHWLELDKKPGTENYTIIFSPEPLSAPAFLSSQATGKPLSDTEQAELSDFLTKYKTSEPVTEINDKSAEGPFVTVKVPQRAASGNAAPPVLFEVRIQHK